MVSVVDLIKEHLDFLSIKYIITREADTEFTFHLDYISKNKVNVLSKILSENGFFVTFNNSQYIVMMDKNGQRVSFMFGDDLLYKIRVYTTAKPKHFAVKVHRLRSVRVQYRDDIVEHNNIIITLKISKKIKDLLILYSRKIGKTAGELIRCTLANTILKEFDADYDDKKLLDGDISVLSLKINKKLLEKLDNFATNHKVTRSAVVRYIVYLILKNAGVF
ncbi:hypothetical protein AZ270_gp23 [Acidianus tailed spindle virus]|uniref:hypothetical protein n=1 Tax=Acidianus tailed spindle virus TaxID=1797140 RepID=UPI00076F2DD2|nr:hypothetical protein AZ270_gp23 [Acidianus tailed spindle virus]AME30046.1 hypothetical protein ATSV_A219 [Acidianus tailed spindle virus]